VLGLSLAKGLVDESNQDSPGFYPARTDKSVTAVQQGDCQRLASVT